MAKRKRLTPANPAVFGAAPEVKGAMVSGARAPIADVASEAATTAALTELTQELTAARETGRMVLSLPLSEIKLDHLVRDRIAASDEEMEALSVSISARGQQTPIEVMALPEGGYGLISGWRRCQAIAALAADGAHDGKVLALLRKPGEASEAYLAMVEENEIRVGLSYFERARIAAKSVDQGVFETEKAALLSLFHSASRAKRSKIRSFLPVVRALDGVLRFPQALSERLGLRLSTALTEHPALATDLRAALTAADPQNAEAELACIARVLEGRKQSLKSGLETKLPAAKRVIIRQKLRPNLEAHWDRGGGTLTLEGEAVTEAMRDKLFAYLKANIRD
ncbi:ParB/RepB/Spo0J family partition protein [Roseobacteraceae bacterium S113]